MSLGIWKIYLEVREFAMGIFIIEYCSNWVVSIHEDFMYLKLENYLGLDTNICIEAMCNCWV